MNTRLRATLVALSLLALAVGPLVGAVSGASLETRSATLNGKPISLNEVARYHCNDLAYPAIRCFSSQAAAAADAQELSVLPEYQRIKFVCAWLE